MMQMDILLFIYSGGEISRDQFKGLLLPLFYVKAIFTVSQPHLL